MKKSKILLIIIFAMTLVAYSKISAQSLLHQITRGDINFQLYDNGFKINSVSTGNTLLETYQVGTSLPIGLASYPFCNFNYANYIHLVVQDNALFTQ